MKKYIQLTAGRGPVECARCVALVARELLKDFPMQNLWKVNRIIRSRIAICRCCFLLKPMSLKSRSGQGLYCGVRHQIVTVPVIPVRTGLSVWNLSNPLHCRKYPTRILFTRRCAPAGMAGRTSTKWRQRSAPLIFLPGFLSDAVHNVHSHKTRKWHAVCFS